MRSSESANLYLCIVAQSWDSAVKSFLFRESLVRRSLLLATIAHFKVAGSMIRVFRTLVLLVVAGLLRERSRNRADYSQSQLTDLPEAWIRQQRPSAVLAIET